MASASGTSRVLRDEELLDYYDALQSDLSDLSDFEDDCDGDAVYNTSAVIGDSDSDENDPPAQAASQTKKQRTGIQWHSGKFVPKIHRFNDEKSGISVDINDDCTVLDFFKLFFPVHIMQHIANETNKYYIFLSQKIEPSPSSRLQSWKNTTPEELYIFFALTMLMARVKKLTIAENWSKDLLISTPQFCRLHVQRQVSFTNNWKKKKNLLGSAMFVPIQSTSKEKDKTPGIYVSNVM